MAEKIISDEFISKYKNLQPNWGFNGLGYVTYRRTYSRLKEDNTHEEWYETVARCVNGAQAIGAKYTQEEAEKLYDYVFNLKCNFAGRMLWQLGTSNIEKYRANALLNCFFTSIRKIEDFLFVFENLMLGGGVGVSVKREDIHELPRVMKGITVSHQLTNDADFIVPDSRQGWVLLLHQVLKAYFIKGKSFTYSTILVRPAGRPIKGFGGVASGPSILVEGMDKITNIIKEREGKKLRSIDVMDICNIIGSIVVAGNVRRCISGDHNVLTDQGSKNIKKIEKGDLVKTKNGYKKVKNIFNNGIQDIKQITTLSGNTYKITPNHKLLIYNTEKREFVWMMVNEINPEIHLLVKPKK